MINVPANDEVVKKLGGDPYAATVLVAKRAKELEQTKKPFIETENAEKQVTVACEEAVQGKITFNNYKKN